MMNQDTLFPILDVCAPKDAGTPERAPARVQLPVRNQLEIMAVALEDLVAEEHPVRVVWAFVERQDLSALYERILATQDRPGHPAIAPELLVALWLNATLDAVGSAREVARRCTDDVAYRWLCGGVSVNYHTLSDFRVDHDLLTRDVAAADGYARGPSDLQATSEHGRMRQRDRAQPWAATIHGARAQEDQSGGAVVRPGPQSDASALSEVSCGIAKKQKRQKRISKS